MCEKETYIPALKEYVRCTNPPEELHPCPYLEDAEGDSETLCNCCESCQNNCADDI